MLTAYDIEILVKNLQGLIDYNAKWPNKPLARYDVVLIKTAIKAIEQLKGA